MLERGCRSVAGGILVGPSMPNLRRQFDDQPVGQMTKLLPVLNDPDSAGFFEAAARGELVVRTCANCASVLHLPRAFCSACGAFDAVWSPAAPRATLFSWTTVEHQVHPGYPVPFTIVLVDLESPAGVRLVGRLPGRPPLEFGQAMELCWEELEDAVVVPNWRPATEAGS
jgi:uncharacterized OB-fold protein